MLIRRICLTIKRFFYWWPFSLFLWPSFVIQGSYCKEKLGWKGKWTKPRGICIWWVFGAFWWPFVNTFFVITYFPVYYIDFHDPLGGVYTPITPLFLQACKGIFCFENSLKGSVCKVSPFESKQYPLWWLFKSLHNSITLPCRQVTRTVQSISWEIWSWQVVAFSDKTT